MPAWFRSFIGALSLDIITSETAGKPVSSVLRVASMTEASNAAHPDSARPRPFAR